MLLPRAGPAVAWPPADEAGGGCGDGQRVGAALPFPPEAGESGLCNDPTDLLIHVFSTWSIWKADLPEFSEPAESPRGIATGQVRSAFRIRGDDREEQA